jgi:hypothetical protein
MKLSKRTIVPETTTVYGGRLAKIKAQVMKLLLTPGLAIMRNGQARFSELLVLMLLLL